MPNSHEIARKLLTLPDLPLMDEYAENVVIGVTKTSYNAGSGSVEYISYQTDDFIPEDEEPDEDPDEEEEEEEEEG